MRAIRLLTAQTSGGEATPPPPSQASTILVPVAVFAAIWLLWKGIKKIASLPRPVSLEAKAEAFVTAALAAKRFTPIQSSAILSTGEEAYFQETNSALLEPRAVRHYSSGGGSVRLAKGFSMRGTRGQSFSAQEWTELDRGSLVITGKRLLFLGSTEHRSMDIDKIDSGTLMRDGFRFSLSNKSKPIAVRVTNPWLLAGILALLKDPERHGLLLPEAPRAKRRRSVKDAD